MIIKYNKINLHTLTDLEGKQFYHLRPGINEFPSAIWKLHENDVEIKQMLDDGAIELPELKVIKAVGKKKVTQDLAKTDEPLKLKDLDEKKAVELIAATYDLKMLERWMDEENRHKVKRALDKQMKSINDQGQATSETEIA